MQSKVTDMHDTMIPVDVICARDMVARAKAPECYRLMCVICGISILDAKGELRTVEEICSIFEYRVARQEFTGIGRQLIADRRKSL